MKNNLIILLFCVLTVSCINTEDKSQETQIVIDGLGREVNIPAKVSRLITIDRGFSPQVLKVLGKEKLLVATGGVHPRSGPYTTKRMDSFFLVPYLLEIPTIGWAGYGSYDFEKILEVNPDAIIMVAYDGFSDNSYQTELLNRIEQEFNIPVIVLKDYTAIDSPESLEIYYENIKLLGHITDASEQAEKLVSALSMQVEKAKSFIVDGREESMLFLGVTDTDTGGGYVHGQDFAGAALTTSLLGIKNVLTNADMPILGVEHILEFDPDIIAMLDAPASSKSVQIYSKNPIFNNISAVKNKRVYFTGQIQWWGDSKLMLPLQLILFSTIYYQPKNTDYRTLYEEYMNAIFNLDKEESKQLATIHKLDSLLEQ